MLQLHLLTDCTKGHNSFSHPQESKTHEGGEESFKSALYHNLKAGHFLGLYNQGQYKVFISIKFVIIR